jgi:hypothetical protein
MSVNVSERVQHELYFEPFRGAVDGGAGAVMVRSRGRQSIIGLTCPELNSWLCIVLRSARTTASGMFMHAKTDKRFPRDSRDNSVSKDL